MLTIILIHITIHNIVREKIQKITKLITNYKIYFIMDLFGKFSDFF